MKLHADKDKKGVARSHYATGLDIGTSAVRMVKLRFQSGKAELADFSIKQSLKELIPQIDTKKVNTALSGPASLIRYVQFPRMSAAELKQALKFEAQKHIPFSVSELYLDACILKPEIADNKMLVLLVAIKKDIVDQRLALLKRDGIQVDVVDFDSVALVNAFIFSYGDDPVVKDATIALLNIGASYSNLSILDGSIPLMSRDIHAAGNNLTQKIMDIFSVDHAAAESLKRNPDSDKASRIATLAEAALTDIASEVRTSFDFYESQSANAVSKIFLSGGASIGPGVKDMIANVLGLEVDTWDPLKNIVLTEKVQEQKVHEAAHELAVAVGLALRGYGQTD